MSAPVIHLTFHAAGDFAAERQAVAALEDAGFSVGRMQAREPRGILFGDYDIQKWRNLSMRDRAGLHGILVGDMRNGPMTVELFARAPAAAIRAAEAIVSTRTEF